MLFASIPISGPHRRTVRDFARMKHCADVIGLTWLLKLRLITLFVKCFAQVDNKETSTLRITNPLLGETAGDRK